MAAAAKEVVRSAKEGGGESVDTPPSMVTFPRQNSRFPSPLKLEVEEFEEGMNHPRNMWQVYALGGFMILRWAWAKWKKRADNGRAPDE